MKLVDDQELIPDFNCSWWRSYGEPSSVVLQSLSFRAGHLAGDVLFGAAVVRAMDVDKFFMARGDDFADALAAGAWAAKEGGAVLL